MTQHTPEPWYAERTAGESLTLFRGAARDDLAAACRLAKEAVRALGPKENLRAPGPDQRAT